MNRKEELFWERYYRDFFVVSDDSEFCEMFEAAPGFLVVSNQWWFETETGIYPIVLQNLLFDLMDIPVFEE